MSWILFIVGGLLALAAVILVVGSLLPATYRGQATMTVPSPPQLVWAELENFEKHPISGRMTRAVQRLPDHEGLACWTEDLGSSIVTVRTLESEPGTRLVRQMSDSVVPMRARSEIRLEPVESGCRVTGEQTIHVRHGTWHVPLFRIILTVSGGAKRAVRDYVRRIAGALGHAPKIG
ncbi:MAG: SRPBCC family protein [Planctomycetota bacterium]|jgi:hypothetical protein